MASMQAVGEIGNLLLKAQKRQIESDHEDAKR